MLIEKLPVPLLIITQRGRLSYANLAAETTLQMISKGQHFAHIIRAPAFIEAVTATLEDGLERSFEFQAYEGGDRYFEARVSRLSLGGVFGPEDQAIVQVEDRTQTHRAEMLRSDFIANASHELRTPLASIVGYIETLQNHAKEDADARERFLEIMGREAHRMQRLVDELMSLSRIELNEHVRPVERVSLNRIAADCAAVFRPFAQKEGVEILVEIENGDAEVIGDSDQLAQVFTNLIDNAMKYGGEEAQICIQPAAESPAHPGRIGVSVSDTGIGIPKDKISRLTERFYRVNVHQSRNKGGTGLGLAIVKHILNRHRGRLEIVSVLGEGSTFTVWLPKADLSTDVHVLRRDAGRDVVPPARRMPG
ncbi:MAG: ATP-binding protein [Pseudomonadota bacterium]